MGIRIATAGLLCIAVCSGVAAAQPADGSCTLVTGVSPACSEYSYLYLVSRRSAFAQPVVTESRALVPIAAANSVRENCSPGGDPTSHSVTISTTVTESFQVSTSVTTEASVALKAEILEVEASTAITVAGGFSGSMSTTIGDTIGFSLAPCERKEGYGRVARVSRSGSVLTYDEEIWEVRCMVSTTWIENAVYQCNPQTGDGSGTFYNSSLFGSRDANPPRCPECLTLDEDADQDGIPNGDDPDVDGDGIPNGDDPDVDGDGIPNIVDPDVDGDGVLNSIDPDVDGDGKPNGDDADIDGDGLDNEFDDDMDGDGIPNVDDPDIDGDGIVNELDDSPFGTQDEPVSVRKILLYLLHNVLEFSFPI